MKNYRLMGMALLGQAGAVAALFLVFFLAGRVVPTGGVDRTHGQLIWISTLVPIVLIVWAHVAVARQLLTWRPAD